MSEVASPELRAGGRTLLMVVVVATAALAVMPSVAYGAPPVQGQFEPLPDFFYRSAAIAPGRSVATIVSRFITPSSRVFVSVDTTAIPSGVPAVPGVQVTRRGNGYFDVRALDLGVAPSSGIPFAYAVFNTDAAAGYTLGTATLPPGVKSVDVATPAAHVPSRYLLSVDNGRSASSPGLRVSARAEGRFSVARLDFATTSTATRFHWALRNDGDCSVSCASRIASGFNNDIVPNDIVPNAPRVSTPSGVFVTVDSSDPAPAPGLKVHTHGTGFFQAATLDLRTTTRNVPYDAFIFNPPNQWEEYGPTGWGGNNWTIAADPSTPNVQYTGSTAGVWKTVNNGDTWFRAWGTEPLFPVLKLAMTPGNPNLLWAVTYDGTVWFSSTGAQSWTRLLPRVPGADGLSSRGALAVPSAGTAYVCTGGGLFTFTLFRSTDWENVTPPGAGTDCSDVVAGPDGRIYTAFRLGFEGTQTIVNGEPAGGLTPVGGVFTRSSPTAPWHKIKRQLSDIAAPDCSKDEACGTKRSPRLAVGTKTVVLNYDCLVFVNSVATVTDETRSEADLDTTWRQSLRVDDPNDGKPNPRAPGDYEVASKDRVCGSVGFGPQGGYSMGVAVARNPTGDENHFIVAGNDGYVTFDGGASWFPTNATDADAPKCGQDLHRCESLNVGQDKHEIVFLSDARTLIATDQGPFFSTDGGRTWLETEDPYLRTFAHGPPITELFNLTVAQPDAFGRVFVAGDAQDHGEIAVLGRSTGFVGKGGEAGRTVVAPKLTVTNGVTHVRSYSTNGERHDLEVCSFDVEGPDYRVPDSFINPGGRHDEDSYPEAGKEGSCPTSTDVGEEITSFAVSQQANDTLVAGTVNGALWRARRGTNGVTLEKVPNYTAPDLVNGKGDAITSVYFASDTVALIGYASGSIKRVTSPFAAATSTAPPAVADLAKPNGSSGRVVGFAGLYGDASNLYVAHFRTVNLTSRGGAAASDWTDVTGATGALHDNVTAAAPGFPVAVHMVGIVRDPGSPNVYVATGRDSFRTSPPAGDATVFVGSHPLAAGAWTRFDTGLPRGIPITGIGISPNRALFIGTMGAGMWWRRDVGAAAGSGLNAPSELSTRSGTQQLVVTTCSDPNGWKHVRTIELKLAQGFGAEDGRPFALWARFDQETGKVGVYDPDAHRFVEGTPGERRVLHGGHADLDLSRTSVKGLGPTDPTVKVTWAVTPVGGARGELQQFLRVTDDDGFGTTWDRVGTWRLSGAGSGSLPYVIAVLSIVGLFAVALVLRRRGRR